MRHAATSLFLPERLWPAAGEMQAERLETDLWLEPINNYLTLKNFSEISVMEVLVDNQFLQLQPADVGRCGADAGGIDLRALIFEKQKKHFGNVWKRKA